MNPENNENVCHLYPSLVCTCTHSKCALRMLFMAFPRISAEKACFLDCFFLGGIIILQEFRASAEFLANGK